MSFMSFMGGMPGIGGAPGGGPGGGPAMGSKAGCPAMIFSGAAPPSTQSIRGVRMSNWLVPSPPPQ